MKERRPSLKLRMTQELRAKLKDAADASGRSMNREIEYRLECSFISPSLASLIKAGMA